MPAVSVVMPAYNAGAYIGEALDSILAQGRDDVEVIVVDDGSSDDTLDVARSRGTAVRVFAQANLGSAVARNRALDEARAPLVAFLDADDVWLPGKLDAQLRALERDASLGGVYSAWHVWKPDASGTYQRPPADDATPTDAFDDAESGWLYHHLLMTSVILTSSLVLRREVIDAVGRFRTDLRRGQDYDYWLRLSRVARVGKLAHRYVLYRMHGASVASLHPDRNYELEIVEEALARYGPAGPDGASVDARRLRERRASLAHGFAYRQFWRGNMRRARDAFWHAARLAPLHAKNWVYLTAATAAAVVRRR
jgi:glycosyltransferase involved in cell wall biosynthesis